MKLLKKLLNKYRAIPAVAKVAFWLAFCNIVQRGISIITLPYFTRVMSSNEYGQFSVYNSWLQMLTILTTLRLNYAVFDMGMKQFADDRDGYTSTMQTVTAGLTLIVFCVYFIFRKQVNQLIELPTFIMVGMFAELLVSPAISFWGLRKRYDYVYKPIILRTLLMAFLNAALGVLAVYFAKEKGYARILSCVAINCIFGGILFICNLKNGKKFFVWKYAKYAVLFTLPLLLHYLSEYILDQFDHIMVQKFCGFAVAGIYSVAYNAGALMKVITTSINTAIVPWQYKKLEDEEFSSLDNILFSIMMFVGICAILFSALSPEIMRILANQEYFDAIYVIPPVAIGVFFSFAYTTFANVEFFYNNTKFTIYISTAGAILNVILNFIGIQLFGYVAAAYTTLICYIVFAYGHYFYMTKCVKETVQVQNPFNFKRFNLLSIIVSVSCILIVSVYDYPVIRYLMILGTIGYLIYKRAQILSILKLVKR